MTAQVATMQANSAVIAASWEHVRICLSSRWAGNRAELAARAGGIAARAGAPPPPPPTAGPRPCMPIDTGRQKILQIRQKNCAKNFPAPLRGEGGGVWAWVRVLGHGHGGLGVGR